MPLLKNNTFTTDEWIKIEDTGALLEGAKIIVSSARLIQDWDLLAKYTGLLGVSLNNDERPEILTPYLSQLSLIVLNFPAYTDGRAYSQAKDLRLDGFRGELRADGNLLLDQFQFMHQVGFDSFAVNERFSLQQWQAASRQMSLAYQRGLYRASGEREVWSQRHQGFAPWEEQPHAG